MQKIIGFLVPVLLFVNCSKRVNTEIPSPERGQTESFATAIPLKTWSKTPSLAAPLPGVNLEIFPLLSSEDTLPGSPGFIFGGQPDGQAFMKSPKKDGFWMITNHEAFRSVSRVTLDSNLRPVKGEYIVDAEGGRWNLCSASLATIAANGFGPLYLTAGEGGEESMVHGIKVTASTADRKNGDRVLPALGKANMENALPLPLAAFPNRTIIMIGEDQGPSTAHQSAGQLGMYFSNTVGDLENGRLYHLARPNRITAETNMTTGMVYDVEFLEIPDAKLSTGKQINDYTTALNTIRFARIEDLDYRKGSAANNREIYFTATGVAAARTNPIPGYNMWGRLYKLVLDTANPLKGKLEVVMDGGKNPGIDLINPDNVCATTNYVYVQEDGDSYYTAASHDSYIWQYHCKTKTYKPVITMNHRRSDPEFNSRFNPLGNQRLGSWEFGAMTDISNFTKVPNTFLLNIHAHTWVDNRFSNPDGSGLTSSKEGGQTLVIKGLPR